LSYLFIEVLLGIHLAGTTVGGVITDFFDVIDRDLGSSIGPSGTDVCEHVGHVLIADGRVLCEAGHEGDWSEGLGVDLDGTGQTVEEDFCEAILVTGDPVGSGEGWSEVGKTFAGCSVTADTGGLTFEESLSTLVRGKVVTF